MRPAQSLTSREAIKINSHARVKLGVIGRGNPRSIVEQHRDLAIFGDGQLFLKLVPEIGGVNHRSVFIDGIGEFFWGINENELGSGQADGAVEGAAAPSHNYFMFQASCVGKLPNIFVTGARHTSGSCGRHGARST